MSDPAPELTARLARVRLLSLDTDGVLTDGGLYYTDAGDELRKFNAKDGLGMKRAIASGLTLAIVTTSVSPSIAHRGRVLGVEHIHLGVEDKLAQVTALCDELGIDIGEVAHVGDDLTDLPLMGAVGCAVAVADSAPEVIAAAHYVTEKRGGDGAVREVCDRLVAARAG